jgi:hypothetical protein
MQAVPRPLVVVPRLVVVCGPRSALARPGSRSISTLVSLSVTAIVEPVQIAFFERSFDVGATQISYIEFNLASIPATASISQKPQHDLGGEGGAAAGLALLAAFGQRLLNDEEQSLVFQGLIGIAHPGLPQVLHGLGDQAVGEAALQTTGGDHEGRSRVLDASRSRRSKDWLSSLMA